MWKTFWVFFLGWLALVAIEDRFTRAGIRDSDVEHFLRMAGVSALVVGMALLTLWRLVALIKFFWEHS
jgi:hypothetical protein